MGERRLASAGNDSARANKFAYATQLANADLTLGVSTERITPEMWRVRQVNRMMSPVRRIQNEKLIYGSKEFP